MASNAELIRPWDIDVENSVDISPQIPAFEQQVRYLGEFLDGPLIDGVYITSVIPSLKYGIMYTLNLVITGESKDEIIDEFETDNTVFDALVDKVLNADESKRQEYDDYDMVVENLEAIESTVSFPFNWDIFVNARKDH